MTKKTASEIDGLAPMADAPPAGHKTVSPKKLKEQWAREIKEGRGVPIPDDDVFRTAYPTIWDYMSATTLADRWECAPPAMTFSWDGSSWRVTFRDNALEHSITVSASTFADLLLRLNLGMSNPTNWSKFRRRGRGLRDLPGNK